MKVYIVMLDYGYDGTEIDSVHATRATAEGRANELRAEVKARQHECAFFLEGAEVYEHDVIGGEGEDTSTRVQRDRG